MRSQRSGLIWLVTGAISMPPEPTQTKLIIVQGIQKALASSGMTLMIADTGADPNKAAPLIDIFTRAVKLDDKGQSQFPELRKIPRNNPDSPQFTGMRELFSFDWSGGKTHALAPDVVFLRVILCTFIFVIVLALLQVGLPLLINQRLRGINVYRAIHFVPVVVSLLWSFVCDQQNGCLPRRRPRRRHGSNPAASSRT